MRHCVLCCALALGAVGLGCSGAPVKEVRTSFAPQVDVSAPLRANARWLPASVDVVLVADVDATLSYAVGPPVEDPNSERAAKLAARESALRDDVRALSIERFGVDATGAHTIIAGASTESDDVFALVMLGATHEGGEEGVFKLVPRHPADVEELGPELSAWAVAIPDGVAVYSSRELAEAVAKDASASFESSPSSARLLDMLAGKQGRMAFAIMPREGSKLEREFVQSELSLDPDILAVSVGDETHVVVEGDAARLAEFEKAREAFVASNFEIVDERYAAIKDVHMIWALASALNYHAVKGAGEALTASLEGSRLTYSVPTIPAYAIVSALSTSSGMIESFEWERDWKIGQERSEQAFAMNARIGDAIKAQVEADAACADVSGLLEAPPSSPVPKNGETVVPDFAGPQWASLGFADEKAPQNFSYSIASEDPNEAAVTMLYIVATADFDPKTPEVHTVRSSIYFYPNGDRCEAVFQRGWVEHTME